jgi:hypothetical protein
MDAETVDSLNSILRWMESSKPRLISPALDDKGCVLFTDGACEPQAGILPLVTVGAVLVDLVDGSRLAFGTTIADSCVQLWMDKLKKKQMVTEAEVFAVLLSFRLWFRKLLHRKVVVYVDSEPAMYSYIRGTSYAPVCAAMIRAFFELQSNLQSFLWFSRVPTKSNPADLPSRLDLITTATEYDCQICEVTIPDGIDSWMPDRTFQ